MRTLTLALTAGLLIVSTPAEAKKKKKKKGEEEAPAQVEEEITPETPGDKDSEKFAAKLITLSIENFVPLNAGAGAAFVYNTLDFAPDNTWTAAGYVELMGERMDMHRDGHLEHGPGGVGHEGDDDLDGGGDRLHQPGGRRRAALPRHP